MISLQPLFDLDGAGLAALLDEGRAEGFRFLERLATEWSSGELRFQRPGEVLLGVYKESVDASCELSRLQRRIIIAVSCCGRIP